MKKFYYLYVFLVFFFSIHVSAQTVPNGFSYQSIVRDAVGLPLPNQAVTLRISIRQTLATGTIIYQEQHTRNTNQFGLVNLIVGSGTVSIGTNLNTVNWTADKHFVQVEVFNGTIFVDLGTSEFQTVPYAFGADNSLKIQNTSVSGVAPTANQVLQFNAISGLWEPTNVSGVSLITQTADVTVSGTTFNIGTASGTSFGLLSPLDYTTFSNKVSSQWISNSPALYTNSYVGIGTATPINQLHVVSPNVGTAGFITVGNNDNSKFANLYSGSSGTDFSGIGYGSTHGFEIGSLTNPTATGTYLTRFRIDPTTGNVGIGLGNSINATEKLTVQGNSSVSGIGYFGSIIGNNLIGAPPGSVLTVNGTTGLIGYGNSSTSSQWITTTSGIYYDRLVGIGTNPQFPLHISTVTNAAIKVDDGVTAAALHPNGIEYVQYFTIKSNSFNGVGNQTGLNRFKIDPSGNVIIGNLALGAEKLTVEGNVSVLGINYASGLKAATLTLTGIGSGILTVDGLGNVTTTSLNISNVFTQSVAGNSFTNDNIVIQGATTSGVAKLKVKGDLSAGGQVIASQSMNPTGAFNTLTPSTIYKQRIYIPAGTNDLTASFNAYEFVGTGGSTLEVWIGNTQVGTATLVNGNNQNTTLNINNIPVSTFAGTFQTLEIKAQTNASAQGVILQGYTLVIKD